MKIFNNPNINSANLINPQNNIKAKREEIKTGKTGNFDTVSFEQSTASKTDAQFIALLKNKLTAEVKEGVDPKKVEDLQNQVALNTYHISPAEIARKMMFEFEL